MKRIIFFNVLVFLFSFSCNNNTSKRSSNENNDIKEITIDYKALAQLIKLECSASNKRELYKLDCQNIKITNEIEEGKNNVSEIITVVIGKESRKIIRKIDPDDLLTSSPFVYFDKENKTYILFFPLVAEYNFGWELYCYKDNKIFPLGQRIIFWKAETEESNITYGDFIKIYKSDGKYIVAMPKKYILADESEYKNYPDYLEGTLVQDENICYFEFPYTNLPYYKKYINGYVKGDYEEFSKGNNPKNTITSHSDDDDLGKVIFSKKIDMNKDGIEDRIIVYNQEEELFSTIKIVLSDKGKYKTFFNSKMINNSVTSGEGFRNISFENRFFTIEENTSTDPVQLKYTTFSIDYKTNEIFLYKVEVSNIFNNASDDFDIIRTQKDFGKISFEDYAS